MSRTQTEVKVVYAGFISAWFGFLIVLRKTNPQPRDISTGVLMCVCIVAALAILVGFMMRKKLSKLTSEALAHDPRKAIGLWRGANFLSFSCAINPAIYGTLLKLLGSGWQVPGILFGLSLGFLLLWRPADPPMFDQPR